MPMEFGGSVLCIWDALMYKLALVSESWLFQFMATRSYQLFLGRLLTRILLVCSVMHSLMPAADELGSKGDSRSSGPVVSSTGDAERSSETPPAWGAEFHMLSAFPKSGVQLQKSWQLSALNWLGMRRLFLWKNSQGFKIAYVMNQDEMLGGGKPHLTLTCVLCIWVGVWKFLGESSF